MRGGTRGRLQLHFEHGIDPAVKRNAFIWRAIKSHLFASCLPRQVGLIKLNVVAVAA